MANFQKFYDKSTLTVEFPDILDRLQGSDTNIEMVTSSTIQKLRISVQSFQITQSAAYIFSNSSVRRDGLVPLFYSDCEKRTQETEEFFNDLLKFDKVEVY